jgi:hypothetical protein
MRTSGVFLKLVPGAGVRAAAEGEAARPRWVAAPRRPQRAAALALPKPPRVPNFGETARAEPANWETLLAVACGVILGAVAASLLRFW